MIFPRLPLNLDEQSNFDWAKGKRTFMSELCGHHKRSQTVWLNGRGGFPLLSGMFNLGGQMGLISPLDWIAQDETAVITLHVHAMSPSNLFFILYSFCQFGAHVEIVD
jgi:hypothetical protein